MQSAAIHRYDPAKPAVTFAADLEHPAPAARVFPV